MSISNLLADKAVRPVDQEEQEFWDWLSLSSGLTDEEANIKLRLAAINYQSTTCGPGIRTEIFFQGCNKKCPGCFSPETWDYNQGLHTNVLDVLLMIRPAFSSMSRNFSPLISFCGGEPLDQGESLAILCKYINKWAEYKNQLHRKHILIYTGYVVIDEYDGYGMGTQPHLAEVLKEADVVVHGAYDETKKFVLNSENRNFIGSSNQKYVILDDFGDAAFTLEPELANKLANLDPEYLLSQERLLRKAIRDMEFVIGNLSNYS